MNGSYGINTISPKQVDRLLADFQATIDRQKRVMEDRVSSFFHTFSLTWEDNNAVKIAKDLENHLNNDVIGAMEQGFNSLSSSVIEISNYYARAAGKPLLANRSIKLSRNVSAAEVKSEFPDGSYGFKEPKDLATLVQEFLSLEDSFSSAAVEMHDSISRINAFGNMQIRSALTLASSKITDALLETVTKLKSATFTAFEDAGRKYNITSDQIAGYFTGPTPYGFQTYFDVLDGLIVQ